MLCGIDEAGRGCLAGNLVVAGCVLHEKIEGLKDSKKLSEKKRKDLYKLIVKNASYKIVIFTSEQVDTKGLSKCLSDALWQIQVEFSSYELLFDGNTNFGIKDIKTLVKADAKVPEVSAASILAKFTRDRSIQKYAKIYPHYGFENNKGYGSKAHIEAIKKYGLSPIHRKSYRIKALQDTLLN